MVITEKETEGTAEPKTMIIPREKHHQIQI